MIAGVRTRLRGTACSRLQDEAIGGGDDEQPSHLSGHLDRVDTAAPGDQRVGDFVEQLYDGASGSRFQGREGQ
jgi:hypothetical protein